MFAFTFSSAFLPSLRRTLLASLGLLTPALVSAQTIASFAPTTAAAGATVVITGLNLGTTTSVQLNGQKMRVVGTPTATSVSVIVPPAAATGRMRLTTTTGTVLSAKLGITRKSSSVSYGQQSTAFTGTTASGNYSTPTAGDLDNDGLVELLVGQGDGTIMLYEQAAANSFTLNTGVLLKNADGTALDVGLYAKPTVADLDGDGLLELLVGEDTGNVLRYEQLATSGANALLFSKTTLFTNPFGTATSSAPNGGSYARPTVADLDNNGLLDILVGSNDGTLRRYEQALPNGSTTADFTAWGQLKLANGTVIDAGDVDKPLLTDYNGDGYLDMLVGTKAGTVMLYTQSGLNAVTFNAGTNLTTDGTSAGLINLGATGTNPSNVGGYAAPAVTDMDGDGLLDLFLGNGNGTIFRYEQTQSATTPSLVAPLPVQLISFEGAAVPAGNRLNWATAQEINSKVFVVETSTDGKTFATVAELPAAGRSVSPRAYEYFDASAAAQATAVRYYRLRQVDLDGATAYSPVVVLRRSVASAPATADAYPNPFVQTLSVALPGSAEPQAVAVSLTTLAGRPVYAAKLDLSATPQALAALPELAAGVYVLRLTTATGTLTQKVTRQ
ncbi:T9SS type A sorting domain-containing protein [Hymenobacter sp. 5317J-9]|uniref:T9SS type A sorting domain-containing protein n=1 Tax=Hymenobacter sp. 5317J-9 TaxID=2932250 RepID=UPI001FD65D78|nr:T9SS type A sorting domain-containing protein [Hymenobacter sp. 5317J-9]UOQ99342.1 T9SS type A sorting domain-containing protein [Hymenobacter sp. 5317J-9]